MIPVDVCNHRLELLAAIAAVGEQFNEHGLRLIGSLDQAGCAVAVLNAGAMHHSFQHVAHRVGHGMGLAPLDLLACLKRFTF